MRMRRRAARPPSRSSATGKRGVNAPRYGGIAEIIGDLMWIVSGMPDVVHVLDSIDERLSVET